MKVEHRNPFLKYLKSIDGQVVVFEFDATRYLVTVDEKGQILYAKRKGIVKEPCHLPYGFKEQFYAKYPEIKS